MCIPFKDSSDSWIKTKKAAVGEPFSEVLCF